MPGRLATVSSTLDRMFVIWRQIGLVKHSSTRAVDPSTAATRTSPMSMIEIGTPVAMEHGSTTRRNASRTAAVRSTTCSDDMAGSVCGGVRRLQPILCHAIELVALDRFEACVHIEAGHARVVPGKDLAECHVVDLGKTAVDLLLGELEVSDEPLEQWLRVIGHRARPPADLVQRERSAILHERRHRL